MNKEEITEVLCTLAEKFGTTTEFLWTVMIKQSYVTGVTHIIVFILSGMFIFAWNRYVWSLKFPKEPREDASGDKTFGIMVTRLIGAFGACVWSMALLFGLNDLATALINPEFWVLKQVFGGLWK